MPAGRVKLVLHIEGAEAGVLHEQVLLKEAEATDVEAGGVARRPIYIYIYIYKYTLLIWSKLGNPNIPRTAYLLTPCASSRPSISSFTATMSP